MPDHDHSDDPMTLADWIATCALCGLALIVLGCALVAIVYLVMLGMAA